MYQKQFLVTVLFDDRTRLSIEQESKFLAASITSVYKIWSSGPLPAVEVLEIKNHGRKDNAAKQ